mgnify:CR=1 FL=1
MKTTFDKVKALLEKDEMYRESDEKLVCRIWNNELADMKFDSRTMSSFEFFRIYVNGNITTADVITRARRKVQEKHPELRGNNYNQRQQNQTEVKEELKKL